MWNLDTSDNVHEHHRFCPIQVQKFADQEEVLAEMKVLLKGSSSGQESPGHSQNSWGFWPGKSLLAFHSNNH